MRPTAKEYDPPHHHVDKCYATSLTCTTREHQHVDRACYYQRGEQAGQLKCGESEHTHHARDCYTTFTICGYG